MYTHPYRNKPFPFDIVLCPPEAFPTVREGQAEADAKLSQEVLTVAADLVPTEKEKTDMKALVDKVKGVLEKIRTSTDADYLPGVVLAEEQEVGSYRKDTMLRGHRVADVMVVTKTMPTFESIASLGQKLCNELSDESGVVSMVSRDFGLILTKKEDKVRLLVTTVQSNTGSLEADLHLSHEVVTGNQAAAYHAKCFESFDQASTIIRPLVRVFKAMRRRFPGLECINIWAFESLIQYCIVSTPTGSPLTIGPAFKRVLAQLSAGIFLPNSSGLTDPVDHRYRLCDNLAQEDMDRACSTAQTLLRILAHGGSGILLGTAEKIPDISCEMLYLRDVAIAPLEKAYIKPQEPADEQMETEVAA